jgi:hypothetical protein
VLLGLPVESGAQLLHNVKTAGVDVDKVELVRRVELPLVLAGDSVSFGSLDGNIVEVNIKRDLMPVGLLEDDFDELAVEPSEPGVEVEDVVALAVESSEHGVEVRNWVALAVKSSEHGVEVEVEVVHDNVVELVDLVHVNVNEEVVEVLREHLQTLLEAVREDIMEETEEFALEVHEVVTVVALDSTVTSVLDVAVLEVRLLEVMALDSMALDSVVLVNVPATMDENNPLITKGRRSRILASQPKERINEIRRPRSYNDEEKA